jgi:hypothetical protein
MAGSIWSAALPSLGEASGWISPALASARSVMGNNRTRGLTVAVLKEEGSKELLLETLPTPGLPKLPAGGEAEHKEKTEEEEGKVGVEAVGDKDIPGTPLTGSSIKPRESELSDPSYATECNTVQLTQQSSYADTITLRALHAPPAHAASSIRSTSSTSPPPPSLLQGRHSKCARLVPLFLALDP